MAQTKGIIVMHIPGKKGKWEIVAIHNKKAKKAVKFKALNGAVYEGYFEFSTRLISKNGNMISTNPKQFNAIAGAKKNIKAVQLSA